MSSQLNFVRSGDGDRSENWPFFLYNYANPNSGGGNIDGCGIVRDKTRRFNGRGY